jgi:hypothetical protein
MVKAIMIDFLSDKFMKTPSRAVNQERACGLEQSAGSVMPCYKAGATLKEGKSK